MQHLNSIILKVLVHVLLKPSLKDFEHCLLAYEMSTFEHSLALPFLGIGMKTDLFQSCGHCWVFQISWHIECQQTASFFRVWNISAGIPSHLHLTVFIVMLPKAHLTSHSRMFGSKWVIQDNHMIVVIQAIKILFSIVLLCILATSSYYLLLLLSLNHFCPFLCSSLKYIFYFPLQVITKHSA